MAEEADYVNLKVGKPVSMIFDNYAWQARDVIDPELGFSKTVHALVFHVRKIDGRDVSTIFSLISEKAKNEITPYLENDRYKRFLFTYIKERAGFVPPRILSAVPF